MDGLMSYLRMSAVLSSIDLPIDQKPTSRPCAECEIKEASCRNASPTVFTNRGYIGVYIHIKWAVPLFLHHRFKRYIPPGRLMQRRNDSLFPIQGPPYGCTHAYYLLFRGYFGNHVVDVYQVCFKTCRCGCSCAAQDVSLAVRRGDYDFCPTDVQSNKHCHVIPLDDAQFFLASGCHKR